MDSDYMPDYVYQSYCRDNDGTTANCRAGDAPYYASAFNRIYYNPMFTYSPPVNHDGTSKTSYGGPWTSVPKDGYGIQSGSSTDLTTQYPERVACKNASDDPNGTDCKTQLDTSNNYIYPDSTYDNWVYKYGAPFYYNVSVEWCSQKNSSGVDKNFGKAGTCQARKTSTYQYVRYYNWSRIDIKPTTTSYPGPNGTTRTYAEEMTNFANWYAWYRTRMQMTKTGVGRGFADVRGTRSVSETLAQQAMLHARIGLTMISDSGTSDGSTYLAIDNFDPVQKETWYKRLYNANPSSWTPLRGALSKAGQIYAGKKGADPIQYSCQRNFTILSTDGYWNTNTESPNNQLHPASGSYGPFDADGNGVNDQDGLSTVTRPSYEKGKYEDTLADVAYYYYHTDLRPGTCTVCKDNVTPAGTKLDEDDVATHQHMTTFTVGLGVDGTLAYQDGYRTSTTGDYVAIKQGTLNWPDAISNSGDERIDDLWHAAVNGRGTYFSARDPQSLEDGLKSALGAAEQKTGSGAAAATSNLQPTAGDNSIFIANYRTLKWDGELTSYSLDLNTGAISSTPLWQASSLLDAKIAATGDNDTRVIYTSNATALKDFKWADLTTTEQALFDVSLLSQYGGWTTTEKTAATGESLVNYLRGHHRFEDQDRPAAFGTYYRLYRDREKTLGDIVHTQPVYVKASFYNFADPGYQSFKTSIASRAGTVYVGANDGMLHAFDENGNERWAYVPPILMSEMWRLADKAYDNNHRFYVDGPIAVSDANIGGSWKTILVGALGKGGRGYFALDITDPNSPKYLWSYTVNDNPDVGYSYGAPIITKLKGAWVVLVTSGHNNSDDPSTTSVTEPGDGKGYVWALDAGTGAPVEKWSTGAGDKTSPAGLASLNVKAADFELDNAMIAAYGGDLLGNLWRFKDDGTTARVISLPSDQPITAAPEIGEIDGKTVLFFGTGRYLGSTDLALDKQQALYAVKDNGTTASSLGKLTQKTISGTSISGNNPDWGVDDGWYMNLPVSKERVHLSPQLYFGTVIFASTIPEADACQPGGYGRVYFLDYRKGGTIENKPAYTQYTSPVVGFTIAKLPGGTPKIYTITADGGYPKGEPPTLPITTGGTSAGSGRRIMWRELLN
jgi:type IV pilus assembly protein PilY1